MARLLIAPWACAFALAASACSKPESTAPPPPPAAEPAAKLALSSASANTALAAPAAPAAPAPLNVLFLSVDSLRADMPWAGYPREIAPRLNELRAKSTAYTRAYSTSSFTSKSVPGMLTGRYPSELARTGAFFTRYTDKSEFMCTGLDALGIACVGAHAHAYFGKGQSGFEHGFRDWRIVPGITFDYQTDPYVTSQKLTPLAIELLTATSAQAEKDQKPFFAWFHYMDPHDLYQKHDGGPRFGNSARDRYDEEVFYTDLWVGKLLDFVASQPWGARTAIVLTADHGEAFGEHGIHRHAHEVWEELVHVPLFVHLPGVAPRVIETPRGAADLVPTFLELLGAPPMTGISGKSLVAEVRGGPAEERDVVVDLPEDDYNERRRALIHGRWKLISFGADVRFSLFDLEEDPREQRDLLKKNPEVAEEMRQRYREAGARIKDVPPRGGFPKKNKK